MHLDSSASTDWQSILVLAGRLERRREKALIVKDRSTVTAASKKAKAAQAKAKADESARHSKDDSKRKSSKSKGKNRAEASDSEASRSANGEYEDGLDITTAAKEEKRKKLKATDKSVKVLREAGQGGRKDPLRRANNMPQSGRMTVCDDLFADDRHVADCFAVAQVWHIPKWPCFFQSQSADTF